MHMWSQISGKHGKSVNAFCGNIIAKIWSKPISLKKNGDFEQHRTSPESKLMGPTWAHLDLSAPDGPHVGSMNQGRNRRTGRLTGTEENSGKTLRCRWRPMVNTILNIKIINRKTQTAVHIKDKHKGNLHFRQICYNALMEFVSIYSLIVTWIITLMN